jgi:hypothetical protein
MNAEEKTALARRAAACSGWRWMPRVLDHHGDTVIEVRDGAVFVASRFDGLLYQRLDPLPDLDDPATLGCLLALVREAWKDPLLCGPDGWRDDDRGRVYWSMDIDTHDANGALVVRRFEGWSEAEALVAALEAASKKRG